MRKTLYLFLCLFLSSNLFSQTILEIENYEYSLSEFEEFYNSNYFTNREQAINEFINTKLKLVDAIKNYQINAELENELRAKFAQTIISNESLTKQVDISYQRMNYKIRLANIFLSMKNISSYQDTLLISQKASKIYEKLLTGENFSKLAMATSDELAVHRSKGDMGYITALQLPMEVENLAYSLAKDSIPAPIRTDKAFYIIKQLDKRKNKQNYKVAHIMLKSKRKAKKIARLLKTDPSKFAQLAEKYSLDKNSKNRGGELDWFSVGTMPVNFEKQVMKLKKGAVSKAFLVNKTWHIVKLIEKKSVAYSKEYVKNKLLSNYSHYLIQQEVEKKKKEVFHSVSKDAMDNILYMIRQHGLDSLQNNSYVKRMKLVRIQSKSWKVGDFMRFSLANNLKIESLRDSESLRFEVDKFKNQCFVDYLIDEKREYDAAYNIEYAEFKNKLLLANQYSLLLNSFDISNSAIKAYYSSLRESVPFEDLEEQEIAEVRVKILEKYTTEWLSQLRSKYKIRVREELLNLN